MRAAAALPLAALVAAALAGGATPAPAARLWRVPAQAGAAVRALAQAAAGDTVELLAGVHPGPLRVERPLVLRGAVSGAAGPLAVVDAGGRGSAITVAAGGATVSDLEVRASGPRVITVDSGIQVINAPGCAVRRVRVRDTLYGIYAERSTGLRVEDCDLAGRASPPDAGVGGRPTRFDAMAGDGNGIHAWYSSAVLLARNRVTRFTDAVYLSFVDRAEVRGNRLVGNARYGLHTMYCQETRLTANHFEHNEAGCAIMFSNRLAVTDNDFFRNRGPRTYGLLLRDCSDGDFVNNRLVENTVALFMDNSNRNRLRGNLLQDNGWGVLMFSSCAGNEFVGNSFVNDDYPVAVDMRRSSNRFDDGRAGNYWSAHAPYDLDGDGFGDAPFAPVTAFAFLSKRYPDLAVLAQSPAVAALGVAERVLPALRPSALVDHRPRLRPARTTGTGAPLRRAGARDTAAAAAAGFGALALAGLGGLAAGARGRTA